MAAGVAMVTSAEDGGPTWRVQQPPPLNHFNWIQLISSRQNNNSFKLNSINQLLNSIEGVWCCRRCRRRRRHWIKELSRLTVSSSSSCCWWWWPSLTSLTSVKWFDFCGMWRNAASTIPAISNFIFQEFSNICLQIWGESRRFPAICFKFHQFSTIFHQIWWKFAWNFAILVILEGFCSKFDEHFKDFLNCEVNFKDFQGFFSKFGENLQDFLHYVQNSAIVKSILVIFEGFVPKFGEIVKNLLETWQFLS